MALVNFKNGSLVVAYVIYCECMRWLVIMWKFISDYIVNIHTRPALCIRRRRRAGYYTKWDVNLADYIYTQSDVRSLWIG